MERPDHVEETEAVPTVAVMDIDGVVADVRHRLHHLETRPKDWHRFLSGAAADPPLPQGVRLAGLLAADHRLVWLTGRPEWLRPVTRRWLEQQDLPVDELLMRRDGDYRPARVMKLQQLRRLQRGARIAAFVDDDSDVVDAALAAGLPAELATWVPRGSTLRDAQDRAGRT